jgi:hypothetical protein
VGAALEVRHFESFELMYFAYFEPSWLTSSQIDYR